MAEYKYLIIGGGMTGDAAIQGIRELDPDGTIGLIGAEHDPPYNRPPLTKGLWKGKPFDSIWRPTQDRNVDLHLGRHAETIDVQDKRVMDDQGNTYTYDKLLLATGGQPRRLPFGGDLIIYYRTVEDFRRLWATAEQRRRFAVIGGGFIGSEIAAALAMNEKEVTMLFPGSAICSRMFPRELSEFLNDFYRQKGVEVLPGESVTNLQQRGEQFVLSTASRRKIVTDCVVAGIGIDPDVELARQAGLQVENGIMVDEFCGTSRPDIYAAGDVALSSTRPWASTSAWSTRTTPTRWAGWRAETWRATPSLITTCRISTPTSSSWATKRSATSTPAWKPWSIGRSRITRASSTISNRAGCGACSRGTSGSRSRPPAR